jgi:cytidine deaminase
MDRELFDRARAARERSYAPYSGFHVGAAIRAADGTVHIGANVENASYPEGWCAETSAIAGMIAATDIGAGRRIAAVCVVADRQDGRLSTPCGGCRQRLAEFAAAATPIEVCDPSGEGQTFMMSELLPAVFALNERR